MSSFNGRDFLLKVGNAGSPENFTTIGAARTNSMTLNNQPVDATTMDSGGLQALNAQAGLQTMELRIDGLFRDSAAEETLRALAFSKTARNFELSFPNGDRYVAAFVIDSYSRGGTHDGLETFSAVIRRSGNGTYTAAP